MANTVMLLYSKTPDLNTIKYPMYSSPKLDGIRAYGGLNYLALSRTDKPIPNLYVQEYFKSAKVSETDGELMVPGGFLNVQSAILSKSGTPPFEYHVFDLWHTPKPMMFKDRLELLRERYEGFQRIKIVPQTLVHSPEEAAALWHEHEEAGYEGSILKSPTGYYKRGRTTAKEQLAYKLKSWQDDEAIVTGIEELMHNADPSSNKLENMVPGNTLGSLKVTWKGVAFSIGSGFDAYQRQMLWNMRHTLMGAKVTFKYQAVSIYGVPRFPIFKAVRFTE